MFTDPWRSFILISAFFWYLTSLFHTVCTVQSYECAILWCRVVIVLWFITFLLYIQKYIKNPSWEVMVYNFNSVIDVMTICFTLKYPLLLMLSGALSGFAFPTGQWLVHQSNTHLCDNWRWKHSFTITHSTPRLLSALSASSPAQLDILPVH